MKYFLLFLNLFLLLHIAKAQCPGANISIDDFSGGACTLNLAGSDPLNTIKQIECTGRSGAISGAADIWIQKNTGTGVNTVVDAGYFGFNEFDVETSSGSLYTVSITYDGTDGNTDPNSPNLSGPVLGNFTNRTFQFKTYGLDPIGPGTTLTFSASVWDGIGNRSDAAITLNGPRSGTTSEVLSLGLFTGTADLTDVRAIQFKQTGTQTGFDISFQQFSAVCDGSLLPLKLNSFSGKYNNNAAELNWITSSEINISRFEIESSTDGTLFNKIGTSTPKGSSNSTASYNFTYNTTLTTITYFRLKMIDEDGNFSYSSIISLKPDLEATDIFTVSPTLFTSELKLIAQYKDAKSIHVQIMTTSGQPVYSNSFNLANGNKNISINQLDHLPKGMYIVVVRTGDKTAYKKIVKQ